MYQVYCDDVLLYDPRGVEQDIVIYDAKLKMAVDGAGSLEFTIPPFHPHIDAMHRMKSIVSVKRDGTTIFRGRIVSDEHTFDDARDVMCEGLLACLNDSIQPPYDYPMDCITDEEYQSSSNHVEFLLKRMLANHNRQVGQNQQVNVGRVTVTDPNNYISRSAEDPSVSWDALKDKFINSSLGGHFLVSYTDAGTTIDYLDSFETENLQEVQYSVNLLDLNEETDGGEMLTAVYPIGKDGLTIAGLLDGVVSGYSKEGPVLVDTNKANEYGRITKIVEWEDVTVPEILESKAVTYLQRMSGAMPRSISVSAADMSMIAEAEPYSIGKMVHVESAPHGYKDDYPLMSIEIDLLNPAKTRLTISKEVITYTSEIQQQQAQINSVVNDIKGTVKEDKTDIENRVTVAESALTQAGDNIAALVQRIEGLNRELTELRQTAEGLTVQITNIQNNGVDNIRTSTGYTFGADGLNISKSGEEMQTRIDNTGQYVTRSGEAILTANNEGVDAINLHARQYLIIGNNDRFEDYSTASDPHRTGAFYVGPDW